MIWRIILFGTLFSLLSLTTQAQLKITTTQKKNYAINYEYPIRKVLLYAPKNILQAYYEEQGYPVFKILVLSTKSRSEAMKVQSELEVAFPHQLVEVAFREPNYKVVYGFFKLREHALTEIPYLDKFFLNQRSLVVFTENEPIQKVDSIFSATIDFVRTKK